MRLPVPQLLNIQVTTAEDATPRYTLTDTTQATAAAPVLAAQRLRELQGACASEGCERQPRSEQQLRPRR